MTRVRSVDPARRADLAEILTGIFRSLYPMDSAPSFEQELRMIDGGAGDRVGRSSQRDSNEADS